MIFGAAVCFAAELLPEGNFLLAAGQIRALADLSVLKPKAKADEESAALLYFAVFLQFGGPGRPEVYRDRASSDRLFVLLGEWVPSYGPDYDPGWEVVGRPNEAVYATALTGASDQRLGQLRDIALLYADDEYFSLDQRFNELQARVGAFVAGSPEAKEATDLQRQMATRAEALRESGAP